MLGEDVNGKRAGTLSPRELAVLELTARGMPNARMASELGVTVHAVKFHLASIYRKLGVENRTEAAAAYLAGRLTQTERQAD
jgi:DNA-binding CsgD family transcriptional regulator